MLERFPTIEQCDSRERGALPVSATPGALPRAKDVVPKKNDVAIVVASPAPFLNDHRGNHRARAQCREISIGKMRSLDDGARRVQLSTTPRRDRIARVFLRLPHDFLVFSDNPPWLKFARHRCSLAASLWFLVKNYSRKDSLRIRQSVRGEVERSFVQR